VRNKIGTKEKPIVLKTPPLTLKYTMHVDQKDGKDVLVSTVGKLFCCITSTVLTISAEC
jgi:hypothetical protein